MEHFGASKTTAIIVEVNCAVVEDKFKLLAPIVTKARLRDVLPSADLLFGAEPVLLGRPTFATALQIKVIRA